MARNQLDASVFHCVPLMERAWPAKDVAPLVLLIADPRHVMLEDGTIKLSEEQAKAILEIRLARLTAGRRLPAELEPGR